MITPDTVPIWLREQAWPLGILLIFVGTAFLILKLSATYRRARLSRQRRGITEEIFVDHLAHYNFDPAITGATYRYLQDVEQVGFPVMPSDDLDEDLGMDSDDVEEAVVALLRQLQREYTPGLRHEPILTVEGLVRHLQASPRKNWRVAA